MGSGMQSEKELELVSVDMSFKKLGWEQRGGGRRAKGRCFVTKKVTRTHVPMVTGERATPSPQ